MCMCVYTYVMFKYYYIHVTCTNLFSLKISTLINILIYKLVQGHRLVGSEKNYNLQTLAQDHLLFTKFCLFQTKNISRNLATALFFPCLLIKLFEK